GYGGRPRGPPTVGVLYAHPEHLSLAGARPVGLYSGSPAGQAGRLGRPEGDAAAAPPVHPGIPLPPGGRDWDHLIGLSLHVAIQRRSRRRDCYGPPPAVPTAGGY